MIANVYGINHYNAYQDIIKEYFDMSDKRTRGVLLGINEADRTEVLASLASKLYKNIVAKAGDIDYGQIPASKGDITKIPNFMEMLECLDTIGSIIEHYNGDPVSVNIIREAIDNIKDSKKIWEKGFAIKSEIPMLFYTNICLAIVSSVNLLLSTSIDFINDPENKTFESVLDKNRLQKSKDTLLLKNLKNFNSAYKKKDIEKVMTSVMKAQKEIQESAGSVIKIAIGGIIATVTLVKMILLIIPILQELVYMFYSARQSISDFFDMQAKVLTLNAEKIKERSAKSEQEKKKIYDKQMKTANLFRKISNTVSIKFNNGENKANSMIKEEDKPNYKLDDVVDEEPDSYSKIF